MSALAGNFHMFISQVKPESPISPSGALLMGAGNSSVQPESGTADKNWLSFFFKSSATTGTSRGMYLRLYLSSGAGGEALRAFTTVSNATPADTVNGAHISLNFGSSAGNVTGEAQAVRATFHLPADRTIGGTIAPIKSEVYADGSNSGAYVSNFAFLNLVAAGHGDKSSLSTNTGVYLFNLQGISDAGDGVNGMYRTVAVSGSVTGSLKCKVGSTVYYIPLYGGQS